jgi:hypothetical protein
MSEDLTRTEPTATRCATHPQVETYLRCGRCNTPICPRCLIQTPVGARCRSCARLRRLPMYDVSPRFLLRGAIAAVATAALGAIVLELLPRLGWFSLILGGLLGILVAGAVSRVTNYKRGASLGWTTVAAIGIGFLLGRAALAFTILDRVPADSRLSLALSTSVNLRLDELLLLGIAALIAYNRLR